MSKLSPTGQDFLLHIWVTLASPTHSLPSYFGSGSLHRRLRVWTPPPQVRLHVSHGDHGPQLPLTVGDENKNVINSYPCCTEHINATRQWISDGGTYWGTEPSDISPFVGPLPRSPCLQAEGWGSCRGGYGWWHQNHRWRSRKTRVTSGSSRRPAWLKATKKGQRSAIRQTNCHTDVDGL